jgi:AraC family transcriptional regulator
MSDVVAVPLLRTPSVVVHDVCCGGTCRGHSAEEATRQTRLVFAYRGVFVRHVGKDEAVAEANQVLFFNAREGYRVSHPVAGGDCCLDLTLSESLLYELTPRAYLRPGPMLAFREQRLRIDARAQALVAQLRHALRLESVEPLEGESMALALVRQALGSRTEHSSVAATAGRRKLVDRAKLVLATDLARRWTLAEIAAEVGGSPVYLTQVFKQVEGLPLYRYQLRLRLARALDLLPQYDDLTALGLDLGFASHSHFTTAFRQVYDLSPSEFRQSVLHRSRV